MKKIVYGLALVSCLQFGALLGMESEEVSRFATGAWQEFAEKVNASHTVIYDMLKLPVGWAGENATRALDFGRVSLTNEETKEVLAKLQKSLTEYVKAINAFFNDSDSLREYLEDSISAISADKAICEVFLRELDEFESRWFGYVVPVRES